MNSGVFPCIMGATDGSSCSWGWRVLFMIDIGLAKILLSPTKTEGSSGLKVFISLTASITSSWHLYIYILTLPNISIAAYMWATLSSRPDHLMLTVPYFGQNRPKYVSTKVGHVCWTTCGPALVQWQNNCLLCHLFAKDGPYLFCDIWAKYSINYMGQFRLTSVLSGPEECLQCWIIAWSGPHPYTI